MKHKKLVAGALVLIAAAAGWFCWKGMSPTRVGMVNYPDYMLAAQLDQEIGRFIDVEPVRWNDKTDPAALKRYDVLYFFGMGLQFNDRQQAAIDELVRRNEHLQKQGRGLRPLMIITLVTALANIVLAAAQIAGLF